jgi:hypothetical protein
MERQTWKLRTVHYISYARAVQGGQYDDVAGGLGAAPLKSVIGMWS